MSGLSLGELVGELAPLDAALSGSGAVRVLDVEQDSRRVGSGALFVARSGGALDGARFAADAVARGAAAVLADASAELPRLACPVLRVRDVPLALALAAEAVHGHPSRALSIAGVTGTNGKTSVTWLVQRTLETLGVRCLRVGTLGVELNGSVSEVGLTTPPADVLSRELARARSAGATHAVMEVSSIALSSRRVEALAFDVGAVTNLSRDHLDDHGSFEAYAAAKERLVTELAETAAVLNADDEFARGLSSRARGRVVAVGRDLGADVCTARLQAGGQGLSGVVVVAGAALPFESAWIGAHNVENVGMAIGVLLALGVDPGAAVEAMAGVEAVPGRLERCDGEGDRFRVLVDYAHTPDALERVLVALRPLTEGRLICVFGCGGDRDPSKRAPMGEASGRYADESILTNDNPRSESPEAIARAVEVGLRAADGHYEVCLDRALAIERAVLRAAPGDVVLVAGKGHETYQITGEGTIPFDDREQVRRALGRRRAATPQGALPAPEGN